MAKIRRTLYELYKGKNAYLKKDKKKEMTTARTQGVSDQLKKAGLSQSDIDRLRGKKK